MSEKKSTRLTYLDSSRGLAAFFVLLAHFQLTLLPGWSDSLLWKTPLRFFFDGQAAVLYFFILSGFVLTLSFVRNETLNGKIYLAFIVKRIFRIYPAFLFTLIASFFILKYFPSPTNTWLDTFWKEEPELLSLFKQALLVIRYPNDPELRFLPHDWTLSIEMAISFLLPVLALSVKNNPGIVLAVVYAAVQLLNLDPFVFGFSLGIFIARASDRITTIIRSSRLIFPLSIAAMLFICLDYVVPDIMTITDKVLIHHKSWGMAILLAVILSSERLQHFLSAGVLAFTGRISYSFYLLHFIILFVLVQMKLEIGKFPFLLLFVSLTYLFATASYFLIERPFYKSVKKAV